MVVFETTYQASIIISMQDYLFLYLPKLTFSNFAQHIELVASVAKTQKANQYFCFLDSPLPGP
ncbi:MAG: hypothetical protein D3903_22285 [Candidatus Electrothrix sp. GM3_4]|nr:hypothetical protein [Candidatus Electrothrix sp. GM3_4]